MRHKQWIRVLGLVVAASLSVWAQRGGGGAAQGRGNAGGMGSMGASGAGMGSERGMSQGKSAGSGADSSGSMAGSHANARSTASGGTIASRITANSGLDSKVQALLPAGTSLEQASAGFKNMGQFLAALHVSHNLNIPFADLQREMTDGKSLGQAIQTLSPNQSKSEVKSSVKTAETQAKQDQQGIQDQQKSQDQEKTKSGRS